RRRSAISDHVAEACAGRPADASAGRGGVVRAAGCWRQAGAAADRASVGAHRDGSRGCPGAFAGGCVLEADRRDRGGVAPAMILPAQNIRIMVAAKPVDFRRGHDGLVAVVQSELGLDPHSGVVVVFRSRRADRIKVLLWDGTGLVMVYKRLEQGSFAWPPIREGVMKLSVAQFEALFASL